MECLCELTELRITRLAIRRDEAKDRFAWPLCKEIRVSDLSEFTVMQFGVRENLWNDGLW